MKVAREEALRALCTGSAFVVLALVAYARILPTGFVSDDFDLLEPLIAKRAYLSWAGFFRPITVLSLMLDARVYGAWAPGFHATSIIVHGLNGALLMHVLTHVLEALNLPRARAVAALSAISFVVMPSHTEAVSWIAGRGDVLAAFFGLLALSSLLASVRSRGIGARFASLVFLVLALFSKEAAIVWLPLFFVLVIAIARAKGEHVSSFTRRTLAGCALVLVAYVGVRAAALGSWIGGYGEKAHGITLDGHLLHAVAKFAIRAFVPATSIFDPLGRGAKWAIALVPIGIAALVLTNPRRDSARIRTRGCVALLFTTCFLIAIAPTIGIGLNFRNTEGERFLYLPTLFASTLPFLFVLARPGALRTSVLSLLLVGAQLLALDRVNVRWARASTLAERIVDALRVRDPRCTLVLDVPDNHQGAYVFRMGVGAALAIRRGAPVDAPEVLVRHDVNEPAAPSRVEIVDRVVHVTLADRDAIRSFEPQGFPVRAEGTRITLSLDALPPAIEHVLVFQGGEGDVFRDIRAREAR